MDERERRIVLNETVFREVNEELTLLAPSGSEDRLLDLVCECGDFGCSEGVTLTPAEYERVRTEATRFAVIPGHATDDVETVVERHERYDVVEKRGDEPSQIATVTDPRSD